jgi:hypothetical protein
LAEDGEQVQLRPESSCLAGVLLTLNEWGSAIKPAEKLQIKTRALEAGIVEPAAHLALHNALLIAKVLRYEFPIDWYVFPLSVSLSAG